MTNDADEDASRKRVQTYVPEYQREEWVRRAESMDMSLSEFVRTMTQAGKRGFDDALEDSRTEKSSGGHSPDPDPGGSRLEDRVLSALPADEYRDWDELVDGVREEFEDELGDAVDVLLDEGEIVHRHGRGYSLA